MPSCQLDTTDEAPTLTEAAPQLFAIAATSALYSIACGPIVIRTYEVEAAAWTVDEWRHAGSIGTICAVMGSFCTFNLFWCAEPLPCG